MSFISRKEVNSNLFSINHLQEQIEENNNRINQLIKEIENLKSKSNAKEIDLIKKRNLNLELANNKLMARSNQFVSLSERFDKLKIEINKDEYKRKEFGKNLIKLVSKLGKKLDIELSAYETVSDEDQIYEKIQDDLVELLKNL